MMSKWKHSNWIRLRSKKLLLAMMALWMLNPYALKGQTVPMGENHPLQSLAEQFIAARNETDTLRRLNMLNSIMGGSKAPKYSTNAFVGDLLSTGGNFVVHAMFLVGNESAIHLVGQESKTGAWMRYQLGLDRTNHHRIGLIAQTPSRKPQKLPAGTIASQEVREFISEDMESLNHDYGFSGSLLILEDGEIILEKYCGLASDRFGRLITQETPLSMASGSKMFTAIMIAMAIEEEQLTWDQTIDVFIPKVRHKPWSSKITVRHLLSHTSGLAEYWDEIFDQHSKSVKSLEDIIPFFIDKPLEFKPGEKGSYTNTNFIVLGLILEKIYQNDYRNLVNKMILHPLGMNHTFYGNPGQDVDYYLPGAPGHWEALPNVDDMNSSPAGGLFSTPRDLSKFANALMHHQLVSEKTLEMMTAKQTELGSSDYGYGFEVQLSSPVRYGHGGRGPGHHFAFKIYPDHKKVFILMTNRDSSLFLDFLLNVETLVSR